MNSESEEEPLRALPQVRVDAWDITTLGYAATIQVPHASVHATSTDLAGTNYERRIYHMTLVDGEKTIRFSLHISALIASHRRQVKARGNPSKCPWQAV